MSDKLNTEELIRARLEGAELTPSPETWLAIQRKVRWKQFLRFNPGRFNIYYAGALLLAAASLVLFLDDGEDKDVAPVQVEENSTLATAAEPVQKSGEEAPVESDASASKKEIDKADTKTTSREAEKPGFESPEGTVSVEEESPSGTALKKAAVAPLISPEPVTDQQVQHPPITYITSSVQSGCVPLNVQFSNQSVNATSFSWNFGTGEKSSEPNPEYVYKEPGEYTVTLTTSNHGSPETVSRILILVAAPPVADFQIEEGLKGVGNHVVLNLVNYSSEATLYEWCLVDDSLVNCSAWSSVEQQPNLELNTITPDSRSVRLKAISEYGCIDTTVVALPLVVQSSKTRIKFATAFSPNPSGPGDGSFMSGSKRIDLFHPLYIEEPVEYHMRVFTRRGEMVFETRELYQGWDGYLQQELAPADVYVWMVEGKWEDGEAFSLRGDVTLVWSQYW